MLRWWQSFSWGEAVWICFGVYGVGLAIATWIEYHVKQLRRDRALAESVAYQRSYLANLADGSEGIETD